MPSKHALNVSLTKHLCDFVAAQVASGRFGTASEVVRAALRLLERDLTEPRPAFPGGHHDGLDLGADPVLSVAAAQGKARYRTRPRKTP